jgi:hypothetical protein
LNQTNTVMLAIFVALGVVLVAGLLVIPAIDQAQARSVTASTRNKGQRGFEQSGGKVAAFAVPADSIG